MKKPALINARPLGELGGAASSSSVAPSFFDPVLLTLPCPPSVNKAFKTVRVNGRYRRPHTKDAKDWKKHAARMLQDQKPRRVAGPVLIIVNIERTSKRADIDNRIKLLFDLLVKQGVIEDDSKVAGFAAAWSEPGTAMAHIAILPTCTLPIQFLPSAKENGACGGWFFKAPLPIENEAAA